MLYNTIHGLAEVTGYDDNGEVVDGYRIIYDSCDIPEKFIDDEVSHLRRRFCRMALPRKRKTFRELQQKRYAYD